MFKIPSGKVIACDTETLGLNWRKGDRPYCFSFANEKGDTAVCSFPVDPKTREVIYCPNNPDSNINVYALPFQILRDFFSDPTITKIFHNAQFDVGMIKAAGFEIKGEIICTMNLIRLVRSDAPMKLKVFCAKYLGISDEDEKDLKNATRIARREAKAEGYRIYDGPGGEEGSLAPDYWLAPRALVEKYALTDAARCMAVYVSLLPEIKKEGLGTLWEQEKKTWRILRKIEKRGIRIYKDKVIAHKEAIKKKLLTFQQQAHKITGQKINLNSSLQLRKIFYTQLKESPKFLTPSGLPSTDVDALRAMKHPLAKLILSIRACNKTVEFMDQYLYYMYRHKDGLYYIHPNINQAGAATGRESCAAPNLQQVASGRNDKGIEVLVEARSVFGPRPGYIWRSYDWKNIEVFIPAFASGDEKLTRILLSGGDVHTNTEKELTKSIGQKIDRPKAKTTYFSVQYGIGDEKLAKKLSVSEKIAGLVKQRFKKAYPKLNLWMEGLKNEALIKGCIKTPYERIRYLSPEETYIAPNAYVQGTAADILKSAKIKITEKLKGSPWDAHIVLPIHDELLVEISTKHTFFFSEFDQIIVGCMQDNPELKMPLPIPVSISEIEDNWADKKKVKTI